jgi:dipeptide/tripeptide permease
MSESLPRATSGWRFPRTFWVANTIELFERAAFYGMFIALALYLTERVGFSDIQAGYAAAAFSSVMYLLPPFSGAMADKIGFRRALILAFALLAIGYFLLGAFQHKATALLSLVLIMCGGSIVKPVISATAAHCSTDEHRARAFSIFYLIVNIGAVTGKAFAKPLRTGISIPYLGGFELGLEYINFYASFMALCALLLVVFLYRDADVRGRSRSIPEIMHGFGKVLRNFRFMCLIIIVAGFWTIQGQIYSTMPKYILRLLGEGASPEWLAAINPVVVVALVIPITHLVRSLRAESCVSVSLALIPLSALLMALGPVIGSIHGHAFSPRAIVSTVAAGIMLQALAECFLSPKFMEFASKQAPPGEVGLYMGYTGLSTFLAWAFGYAVSGHLLDRYCPDPHTLASSVQQFRLEAIARSGELPDIYAHANYIWYFFAGVGALAFAAMIVLNVVTRYMAARSR